MGWTAARGDIAKSRSIAITNTSLGMIIRAHQLHLPKIQPLRIADTL
jgi:hypothetical protein